ncbi:TraR/DksA family transcriptional regulator [Candidatus Woesebacteria bacterium]|nr:TraR/DksA family transcriptional regulator [Candidatus Woesebacteria bacterium]
MTATKLTHEQLETLKKNLFVDRDKILNTIEVLKAQDPFNDPDHVNDNASFDTDVREQMGHDTLEAEVKSLKKKLRLVERALRKMDKGTYGIDEKTGTQIPYERLLIVPEAQYTIEVEKRLVK